MIRVGRIALVLLVAVAAVPALAGTAAADTITFDFESQTNGSKGQSHSISSGGFTLDFSHASSVSIATLTGSATTLFGSHSLLFPIGLATMDITAPTGQTVTSVTIEFGDSFTIFGTADDGSATAWSGSGGTGSSLDTDSATFGATEGVDHFLTPTVATLSLSANGISSVTFTSVDQKFKNNSVAWDNITITTTSAVPEPGTLMLLGLGFAGIAARRRRQRARVGR